MQEQIDKLRQSFLSDLGRCKDLAAITALEQQYFSRGSGKVTALMSGLRNLPEAERKTMGAAVNNLKQELLRRLQEKKQELQKSAGVNLAESEAIDVTQPALPPREHGHLHPTTQVQNQLEDLFTSMGFMVLDGPELESEYYNFTALNIPSDHPARDSHDTFYIKNTPASAKAVAGKAGWLMRTHTSPVQIRAMRQYGAPLRAIIPGRCFRNESTDPRHEHTLDHVEGLVIDTDINFAHMKGVLETVARHLYGEKTRLRLRPKFYPFVEPGVNGEVSCFLCDGKGCRLCKGSGWLEIFGAGMVHPNVLKEGNIDSKKYQGFAFGLGLSRLVMLKYGIEDVRHLQSGDMRFLEQF